MAIQIASQKKAGMIKIIPAFLFSIALCLKLYVYLKQLSQTKLNPIIRLLEHRLE